MNSVVMSEFQSTLEGYLSLLFKLSLITNEIDSYVLTGMLFYFFKPLYEVHKGLVSGHVIGQEYTVSTSVEYSGHGFE